MKNLIFFIMMAILSAAVQAAPLKLSYFTDSYRVIPPSKDIENFYLAETYYDKGRDYYNNKQSPEYVIAAEWFQKAADLDFAPAEVALAQMYYTGKGVPKNEKMGFYLLQKAADQRNALGELWLAETYLYGNSAVPINYFLAAKWFEAAAQQGAELDDASRMWAERMLGFLYLKGYGVKSDINTGKKWLKKSADRGDKISAYILKFE